MSPDFSEKASMPNSFAHSSAEKLDKTQWHLQ